METRLRLINLSTIYIIAFIISGCAINGKSDQLLPEKSRATPELALLNQQAQLADAGGEAAQAESLYKAVLRQTPNDTETWFRLGNLYANNNRGAEAAIAYERTLVSDNSHVKAWHNLAIVRLRQSYAALLQAQLLVDENDSLREHIDTTLEQLSKLSILESEPRPRAARPTITPVTPIDKSIVEEPIR